MPTPSMNSMNGTTYGGGLVLQLIHQLKPLDREMRVVSR
jgi:hypothetical protein